jgi:hypothetical protein
VLEHHGVGVVGFPTQGDDMSSPLDSTTQSLLSDLEQQGYFNLVQRDGVWVGLHDYLTTRGLVVGLTAMSYERRYCYPDRASAFAALLTYEDTSTHPAGPWVKLKGQFEGQPVDMFNPSFASSD